MLHRFRSEFLTIALCAAASHSAIARDHASVSLVVDGLDFPSGFATTPDRSGRILVTDYYVGKILMLENGQIRPEPFLDLQGIIEPETENPDVEAGLIAVVLPPGFPKANRAYVTYTGQDNKLILSRFTLDEAGERAIRSSEEILLSFENWGGLHHCGHMEFAADGYLYVCVGDSGSAETAQDLSVLNGSILRLDVESDQTPYAIPPDNPFVGVEGARPEIWVYGVRNPWRFSFDVATGDLYVPDPGVAHWEELTFLREGSAAGANLGWPAAQGNECREACSADDLVWPVHVYPFGERGCSIIGGAVYRGEEYPDWNGVYVFSDFCTGDVWAIKDADQAPMIRKLIRGDGVDDATTDDPRIEADVQSALAGVTSIGVGPDGEILMSVGPAGSIYRLHFPTTFETGWRDVSEVQLADLLHAERAGANWTSGALRSMQESLRWRWAEPIYEFRALVRRWFGF